MSFQQRQIVSQSLAEQCYEVLRSEIASGDIPCGERLYEERIAARLGVSKTPVRLALQRLREEALVEFRERRGFHVAQFASQDVRDVVELREMLEAVAVRRLAASARLEVAEELRSCFSDLDVEDTQVTEKAFATADAAFHSKLIELAGSELLARMRNLLDIRIQFYLVRGPSLGLDARRRLHAEHMAIIAAIEAGDSTVAEQLIREHIADAWRATRDVRLGLMAAPVHPLPGHLTPPQTAHLERNSSTEDLGC